MTKPSSELIALATIYEVRANANRACPILAKEYATVAKALRLASSPSMREALTNVDGAVREALDLLQLEQRGRAQAFRLLDKARPVSDPATLAKADAYEECGNELKAALSLCAVRIDASEQEAESAIRHLKIVIDAAENSNQSGENAVVRAATVTGWKRP